MTDAVHVRANYRYASAAARDEALAAALGALETSNVRCEIVLGTIIEVDLEVPLFEEHDFTLLALLSRTAIESGWRVES